MKKRYLCLLLVTAAACSSDDGFYAEVSKLPEATQIGAGTIGYVMNGRAVSSTEQNQSEGASLGYIASNTKLEIRFNYITESYANYFSLIQGGGLLEQGKTYRINQISTSNLSAYVNEINDKGQIFYFRTINDIGGELTITKINTEEKVFSGTFWFDAVEENGRKAEIREGRFDLKY